MNHLCIPPEKKKPQKYNPTKEKRCGILETMELAQEYNKKKS